MSKKWTGAEADDVPPHERVRLVKDDEQDEGTAVAFGRVGAKPALSVRFCLRTGDSWSLAYSHAYSIHAEGRGKLLLTFTGHTVTIEGRNLHRLHDYLDAHRATKVRESDTRRAEFGDDAAEVVERIVIEKAEG